MWTLLLYFFWSFLGFSAFGKGNSHRLERLFCGQEEEGDMANGTVMLVLGYLEG